MAGGSFGSPSVPRRGSCRLEKATLSSGRVFVCGKGDVSEARSWRVWRWFLVGSGSNVRPLGSGRGQLWKPVRPAKGILSVEKATLSSGRVFVCGKGDVSEARSWRVWRWFLVGSGSNVRPLGSGRGQLWKPVRPAKGILSVEKATLSSGRVFVCGKGDVSEARSWRVWRSSLVGSESNVRHWQGAALEARPSRSWVLFVCGEGDVSEARSWQVWS